MSDVQLVLERRDQADESEVVSGILFTPPVGDDYWSYRVRVGEGQAVVGFPKFFTLGIGFAVEDADWNTNLPYTEPTDRLFRHIAKNKGSDDIPDERVMAAIDMIRAAVVADVAAGTLKLGIPS